VGKMTADDIKILLMQVSHGYERVNFLTNQVTIYLDELVQLAALVAEAEREACAKIADSQIKNTAILTVYPGKSAAAWDIANAIRARGGANESRTN